MKKLLLCTCLIAACLIGSVGNVLYQRSVAWEDAKEKAVRLSTRIRSDFTLTTKDGIRTFRVIEMVYWQNEPFDVTSSIEFLLFEGETEDESLSRYQFRKPDGSMVPTGELGKNINLPEQPAKFSYLNGLWIARFYVLGTDDGAIGLFDSMPTKRTVQKNPEILQSLVSFPIPMENIVWSVDPNRRNTHDASRTGRATIASRAYGHQGAMPKSQ